MTPETLPKPTATCCGASANKPIALASLIPPSCTLLKIWLLDNVIEITYQAEPVGILLLGACISEYVRE